MNKKEQKASQIALKLLKRSVTETIGSKIAEFMVECKEAGVSKEDSAELVSDLFNETLKKVKKDPEKYMRHGGH